MCLRLVELHKTTRATLPDEASIYFENLVDSDVPPADFQFIQVFYSSLCLRSIYSFHMSREDDLLRARIPSPQDYILDEGVIPQSAAIGCSCTSCETDDCQSLHHDLAGQRNYLPDGRLEEWARTRRGPIYECNSACLCPKTCYNRVTQVSEHSVRAHEWFFCLYLWPLNTRGVADAFFFQRGRKAEVVVFKTANDRGWGLRTHTPIKAWTFVMEYIGKVVTSSAAQSSEPTYQFELDFNVEQEAKYVVDAKSHGNASHFINHSVSGCREDIERRYRRGSSAPDSDEEFRHVVRGFSQRIFRSGTQ